MAYDHEEQEQLDSLKAFWNQYGNLLTWVLIILLGAYAGYNYWRYTQRNQAAEASVLFDQLQKSLLAADNAKVLKTAADIEAKYGSTAYAPMAALVAAKSAFAANDLKTAKAQLQWAAEHGNDEVKSIARLRIAGILLDEKAYEEGLKLLAGDFLPQFAPAVADRKGDILVAQNKLDEARKAYVAALAAMTKADPGRRLVEVKLESIGGTVPAKPADAAAPAAA
ncbi:YfgM family protein [Massilia sp. DWR3-1-1]|uniref:YfgM family protein n=1 Tax=Massilia sp. DWR3-1-1 TaxID=2804559 RepID=UPI003CFA49A0